MNLFEHLALLLGVAFSTQSLTVFLAAVFRAASEERNLN